MIFKLKITLGNSAMCTEEDVAEALRRVADKLEAQNGTGNIRDINGNTVGGYEFTTIGETDHYMGPDEG